MPTVLRADILQACHDEPSASHLSISRTFVRIRQQYFWPNLLPSVQHYVSCDCQRRRTPPVKPAGMLHPLDPSDVPIRQAGMNLLGPFPTSSLGNKWVIVATDYLTRYAKTKPRSQVTGAEVAKFFVENIILRYGATTTVITDRGTAFIASFMKSVLETRSNLSIFAVLQAAHIPARVFC